MRFDVCTCEISLTDPVALDAWNGVVRAILSHGQSAPVHLGKLLETAPDFAMGYAIKGLAALMLGRRELYDVAQASSTEAQRCLALGGATQRERLWCQALQDWLDGYPSRSINRMEDALRLNPADTISMKLSHGIRFILGDNHGMRRSVEAVMDAHDHDHPLRGYALGCHAFALEETGSYQEAERAGLAGLFYACDDAWGLHAVAHVYEMTHRTRNGISLIDGNTEAWSHCNNFRFHVWWHKALLHLDEGDISTVLTLYDTKIRDEKTDDYRDFSNASSLLMRLELEGVDVGQRWIELADLAEKRSTDGCLTFADLHYMLALAGDNRGEGVDVLTAQVAQTATQTGDTAVTMADPGIAASKGLAAFSNGQYGTAFSYLKSAQPKFQTMGGSHAQRDVFERITIEAGLRAGQLADTEQLLNARTSQRAGALDAFASSRFEAIAKARRHPAPVAAE